jgi:hypothetical protein
MIKGIIQTSLLLSSLCFAAITVSQPPTEHQYLCPMLHGNYQNGQTVKNSDGYAWIINISINGAQQLDIKHWQSRSATATQNNYLLTCKATINQITVQAQLTVTNMNSCYVIPEINYQLFGCFEP